MEFWTFTVIISKNLVRILMKYLKIYMWVMMLCKFIPTCYIALKIFNHIIRSNFYFIFLIVFFTIHTIFLKNI